MQVLNVSTYSKTSNEDQNAEFNYCETTNT